MTIEQQELGASARRDGTDLACEGGSIRELCEKNAPASKNFYFKLELIHMNALIGVQRGGDGPSSPSPFGTFCSGYFINFRPPLVSPLNALRT